jgi:hypothetical protein
LSFVRRPLSTALSQGRSYFNIIIILQHTTGHWLEDISKIVNIFEISSTNN